MSHSEGFYMLVLKKITKHTTNSICSGSVGGGGSRSTEGAGISDGLIRGRRNSYQTLGSIHPPLCHVTRSSISSRTVTLRLSCHLFSNWKHNIFTFLPPATKLEQGNIFRSVCQEFCSQGRSAPLHAGIHSSPRTRQPPGTRARHHLQNQTSPQTRGRHPRDQTPPNAMHAGRYGQQAGGTHPTGMQSFSKYILQEELLTSGYE